MIWHLISTLCTWYILNAKLTWQGEIMKKEEILEMSRKENKNKDIHEIEVEKNGCKIAAIAMILLTTIYYCYEIFAAKGQNIALYSLISIYCTVMYGYKGIKIQKKKMFNASCSIIWAILTVVFILEYFKVI